MWNNQVYSNDNNLNSSSAPTPVSYYHKDENNHQTYDQNGTNYSYMYNAGDNYMYDRDTDTDHMNRQNYYDHSNQTNYNQDHFNAYSNQNNDTLYNAIPDCSNSSPETNSATSTDGSASFNNQNVDNSHQHFTYEPDRVSSQSSPSKLSISPSSSSSSSTSFDQSIKKTSSSTSNTSVPVLPTMLMASSTCSLTTTTNTITVSPAVSVLLNSNDAYNSSPIASWSNDFYSANNSSNPNPNTNQNSYSAYTYANEIISANSLNNASLDYSLSSIQQRTKTSSNYNLDFDGLNNPYLVNQYSTSSNKAYQSNLAFPNELSNNPTGLISNTITNAMNNAGNNGNNSAPLIKEVFSLSSNRANLNARLATTNYANFTQSSSSIFNHDNDLDILHNHELNEASELNQSGLNLKGKKNYSGRFIFNLYFSKKRICYIFRQFFAFWFIFLPFSIINSIFFIYNPVNF